LPQHDVLQQCSRLSPAEIEGLSGLSCPVSTALPIAEKRFMQVVFSVLACFIVLVFLF